MSAMHEGDSGATADRAPAMPYRTLGRTGLRVSLLGLGSGGDRMMGGRKDGKEG